MVAVNFRDEKANTMKITKLKKQNLTIAEIICLSMRGHIRLENNTKIFSATSFGGIMLESVINKIWILRCFGLKKILRFIWING